MVEKEGRQWNYSSGSGGEKTIELCRGDGGKNKIVVEVSTFLLESVSTGNPLLLDFFSHIINFPVINN